MDFPDLGGMFSFTTDINSFMNGLTYWSNRITNINQLDMMGIIAIGFALVTIGISLSCAWEEFLRGRKI